MKADESPRIAPRQPDTTELYWLSDDQWELVFPYLPRGRNARLDHRLQLSGMLFVLLNGRRWADCPTAYGSPATIHGRYRYWCHRPFWAEMLAALAESGWATEARALDPLAVSFDRLGLRGSKVSHRWRRNCLSRLAERTRQPGATE